jgi:RNA polymerase sigma factor (sigma-70 family)
MRATGTKESELVVAAQAGDRRALDELVTEYLPLVYNIVGRGLSGHTDVDDVVQETMLRAVRELRTLRTPDSFRSWLAAIAVHQVGTHRDRCRVAVARTVALDEAAKVPDPNAGFEELTILRLGLSGQRRHVARASRWLDAGDQVVLSLWWLETAGHLTRAELAAALTLSPAHAGVRVQRMRGQLDLSRALVAALEATPRCAGLSAALDGWNGVPSPLWRKRLARHTRSCAACARAAEGLVPAERLLIGLALVPIPLGLTAALLAKSALSTSAVGGATTAAASGVASAGASGSAGTGLKAGLLSQLGQIVGAHPLAAAVAAGVIAAGTTIAATSGPILPSQPPPVTGTQASPRPATTGPVAFALGPLSLESVNTSPGQYVTLVGDLGALTQVDANSAAVLRQSATFQVVPGLASGSCYSLRTGDGRYLRHASWRLRLGADVGTVLFRGDATFCPRPGSVAGSVSLESFNYPGRYLRHVGAALWIDPSDGTAPFRADSSFWRRPALAG